MRPLLLLVFLSLVACADDPRPDVVLVTIDTLRADRLGAYGSPLATPHIDRLASEGTLFENAVSPLPETRPSHFTLFTGQYPRTHGVTSNALSLSPEALTLAEVFSAAGYRTGAFVGTALLGESSGVGQGFGVLDAPSEPQRPAQEVTARVLGWLKSQNDERPIFLWVHLFDPHMPYEPPGAERIAGEPRQIKRLPTFTWPRLRALARRNDGNLPRWALERALRLYGAEVEHVDTQIGVLLGALAERPGWERSAVVLTADHGECFAGGVYFDHSYCLGEGALAVPMIVRAPGFTPGRRSTALVEHVDVASTLLDVAGLERPPSFTGRGLLTRAEREENDTAFFQHPFYHDIDIGNRSVVLEDLRSVAGDPTRPILGDRLQVGVRRGNWKYLLQGADEELYDLETDPEERVNRAAEQETMVRELRAAVRRWLKKHPLTEIDQEMQPELLEQLRELGYL